MSHAGRHARILITRRWNLQLSQGRTPALPQGRPRALFPRPLGVRLKSFKSAIRAGARQDAGRGERSGSRGSSGQRIGNGNGRAEQKTRHDTGETHRPAGSVASIPYTSATSEFIYGHSMVYAALRAGRRTLHKLYLHDRAVARDEGGRSAHSIRDLAAKAGVTIVEGAQVDLRLLDEMSNGRPHNGVILEASRLRIPALQSLGVVDQRMLSLCYSKTVTKTAFRSKMASPLVMMLDDVLDEGNLGAILRSAYFLGVDAVIITDRCAPLSAITLKASAGAADDIPIYKSSTPNAFLRNSKDAGWQVICASTPSDARNLTGGCMCHEERVHFKAYGPRIKYSELCVQFGRNPNILVVGGEGSGLKDWITREADMFLEIKSSQENQDMWVDSLNVSVAAALATQVLATMISRGSNMHRSRAIREETAGKAVTESSASVDGGSETPR